MRKLYLIRREDFFAAVAKGQMPADALHDAGPIWCQVLFTEEEKANYSFPISLAY